MGDALARLDTHAAMDLTEIQRWSKVFLASGIFGGKGAYEAQFAQAIIKIQYGQELGVPPFAAMDGIDIIDGRPAPNAALTAALVKRSTHYNYRVLDATNERAVIEWFEDGESIGQSSFTLDDADTAGLLGKSNWQKYPSDMLFARALTRGARRFCPDVFNGAIYVAEELEGVAAENAGDPPSVPAASDAPPSNADDIIDAVAVAPADPPRNTATPANRPTHAQTTPTPQSAPAAADDASPTPAVPDHWAPEFAKAETPRAVLELMTRVPKETPADAPDRAFRVAGAIRVGAARLIEVARPNDLETAIAWAERQGNKLPLDLEVLALWRAAHTEATVNVVDEREPQAVA